MRNVRFALLSLLTLLVTATLSAATPEWKNVDSYTGTDAQRITAAITALGTTGGVVYFPPRNYSVDTQVSLNSNITLKGDGYASRIIFTSGVTLGFYGANLSHVTIEDLSFGGSNTATAIKFYQSSDVRIRNLDMSGAKYHAIYFDNVDDAWIENCRFTGNGVTDTSYEALAILTSLCDRLTIANNIITGTTSASPYLTMGIGVQDATDTVVTGNHVSGIVVRNNGTAWGYGIYTYESLADMTRVHITDNRINDTGGPAVYMSAASDSTITGNTIYDVCKTISGGAVAEGAIAVNVLSTRIVVSNNSIRKSGKPGIRLDATASTISGNQIEELANSTAILMAFRSVDGAAPVSGSTITGNSITNCAGGIQFAGPNAYSARVKGLTITGNVIDPGTVDVNGNHGISIIDTDDLTITGNTIRAASGMGIILTDVTAFSVNGNTVRNAEYPNDGIYLDGCSKGVVTNNRSYGTNRYGIVLNQTTTAVRVSDNYTTDNTTGGILDAGVGNTVANNN